MPEALAALLTLIGLLGTFLPALPGTAFIFLTAIGYGWLTGFEKTPAALLWTLGGLAVFSQAAGWASGAVGTRLGGASAKAMAGAAAGAVVGVLVLGPIGIVAGPFLGAFLVELARGRELVHAGRAGIGAGIGALAGLVIQVLIGLVMAILFWMQLFGAGLF